MDRDAHIVLKYMRNVVFAHEKEAGQAVQGEILLQVLIDVVTETGVKGGFVGGGGRIFQIIGQSV